jgi:pantoate--beta-alanine ligase
MIVCKTISELRGHVNNLKGKGNKIGFVPTMGFLHEGHLSLIDHIKPHCDIVVVSIFVNPMQFGPGEDMERYPRDFERDHNLLKERGTDIIFYPAVEEIYPDAYLTYLQVEELGKVLCGRSRPTHFQGVTTIVAKLFLITKCEVAAFGQKDYQQALIIRRMVRDLNFDVEVLVCPIVREDDGLAMSSRNTYLSEEEREKAVYLYKALTKAKELYASGEKHAARLREEMRTTLLSAPEVGVDYLEVVDAETLESIEKVERRTLLAGAVWLGKTRLIDNILLEL